MDQLVNQIQKTPNLKASSAKSHDKILLEKKHDSIQVLSDQEQASIFNERYRREILQNKIQQAVLTKSKYNVLKVLFVELNFQGKSQKQKQSRWNKMVRNYIASNLKTNSGDPYDMKVSFFYERMSSNPTDEYIQNQYILYGCDLLSQKHIEKMFNLYNPSIKWIDSSHCKLTFMQKNQGWQAVVNNCKDSTTFIKDMEQNTKVQSLMSQLHIHSSQSQIVQNDEFQEQIVTEDKQQEKKLKYRQDYEKFQNLKKNYVLLKKYIDLSPYYEMGFKRRLMIRNVTKKEQLLGYNINIDKDKQNQSQKSSKSRKSSINQIPQYPQIHMITEQSNLNKPHLNPLSKQPQNNNNQKSKEKISDYKKFLKIKQDFWKQIELNQFVKPEYEKVLAKQQEEQQLLKFKGKGFVNKNNKSGYNNSNSCSIDRGFERHSNNSYREKEFYNKKNQYHNNYNNYSQNHPLSHNYIDNSQYYKNKYSKNRIYDNQNQFPAQEQRPDMYHKNDPQRNRSREYQRGGYRGGFNGNNYNGDRYSDKSYGHKDGYGGRYNRYKDKKQRQKIQIQNIFDTYIEQRQGLKFQNPAQNLQLAFIDPQTGIHYYKNPLYNGPPLDQQIAYRQQLQQQSTSNYQYGGNSANMNNQYYSQQNQYHSNNNRAKQMPIQAQMSRPQPMQGKQYPTKSKPFSKKSQKTQLQFQQYIANREIQQKPNKKLQNSQQVELQDPNFSVINYDEKNPHNYTANFDASHQGQVEGNLQNILDKIHEDESLYHNQQNNWKNNNNSNIQNTDNNGDDQQDSSNYDFILEQQKQPNIKKQIYLKQQYMSRQIPNYVTEMLPRQQLQSWLNSNLPQYSQNPNLSRQQEHLKYGNNMTNSQTMSEQHQQYLNQQNDALHDIRSQAPIVQRIEKQNNESIKKKIPKKKKDKNAINNKK